MLQFETLLLRQLQKQQNRDELCDTVLQTQGVSVPVHSCVLSAFSPRFFGTLSSMPVPMAGQRRLIELQAVDGCTLLSLVSLLYSGQLPENREQVLSAAQTLGIELPQWQEEERHGEKEGRNKVREDADQEKEVDAQEWKTGKGSRREKEKTIESGTQTGCGKKTDEGGTQADLGSSKPQTMYLIHPSTCPASQELGSCGDIQNVALPLQVIHPERKSMTCDPSAMAPVAESACLSRIYLCSLETSHQQTSTSVSLPPHNSFLDQSMVVPAAGAAAINDLKQFEGNIPGFINYFLDSTDSANKGRRGQGCAREGAKEEQVVKSAKARSTARDSGREWIRWTVGERRQRRMGRWGLVARLAWRGQGGGRVGRPLESRSTGKNQMRAFQRRQVREARARGRGRGRGRCRQRGKTGTVAGREKQNDLPCKRRSRSHPRVRPLPPASRSLSTITTTMHNTVDPTGLDLLHTMTPVPVNQIEPIQPIDTLLEDIITGLHFLPQAENQYSQHGLMSTTTSSGPPISKASYPKPTDPKPHMEGELSDILDHILSTFDQQVGCCGLDVGGETSQGSNKPDSGTDPCSNTSKTFTQLQPYNPHINNQKPQANYLHTSSTLSTQPQSMVNPSVAKKNNVQDSQKRQSKQKKPSRDQNIVQKFENRRLTRSQTMKRKLETALISPQNAVKKKCNEKESADTKKKRQRDDRKRPKCKACVNKSGVKKWDKNNKKMAPQVCGKESQKQVRASERRRRKNGFGRNETSVKNNSHGMDGFKKKKSSPKKERRGNNVCRGNVRGYRVEAERKSNGFLAGGSSVKRQIERPYITRAASAMKKVKMLLQLQDEKEDGRARENLGIYWRKNEENGRLVKHQRLSGAQERFPVENSLEENQAATDKGRINGKEMVKGQEKKNSIVEVRPRREDRRTADGTKQEEMATDRSSVPFQLNLPSDTAKEGIKNTTVSAGTTESVRKVFDSCPGDPVSAPGVHLLQSDVVLASTQSTMHRTTDLALNVGDAPRLSFASRLSHTRPFQELLSPHTSTKDSQQLSGSCVDEEDDVDVVEVSSLTSELPAVSILEVDLSTEDEVEEDFEIDVLGPD